MSPVDFGRPGPWRTLFAKDIDLFVPDPQYLGWVSPRLSDAAESVSADYEEAAEFIKLFLEEGRSTSSPVSR